MGSLRRLRFRCSSHPAPSPYSIEPNRARVGVVPYSYLASSLDPIGGFMLIQIERAVQVLPHYYQDDNFPAVTYFPTPSPGQYRRRWGVSLPCSGWERVGPPRLNHQKVVARLCTRCNILASVFVMQQSPTNKHLPVGELVAMLYFFPFNAWRIPRAVSSAGRAPDF